MKATLLLGALLFAGCGSLEKKSVLVNVGDSKEQVLSVMGPPEDRQLKGDNEAWQYCQTGASFGVHDFRIFWFKQGKVTGINSYKSGTTGVSCIHDLKTIRWEDAPDTIVELRAR